MPRSPALGKRVDRPLCSSFRHLGSVFGDEESPALSTTGAGEVWVSARITENSDLSVYVSAAVLLEVPSGIDYDLAVFCASCTGGSAGESVEGPGRLDVVRVRWEDQPGLDDSRDILIHVRYSGGSSVDHWTLRVDGNEGVEAATCSF